MWRLPNKTYNASSTPPASVRLNRTMRQCSPHPTAPLALASPESARRWLPHVIFSRCTVGSFPMTKPDASSNASTDGSLTSTYNWTTSPDPKNNEERLAGQEALPTETGSNGLAGPTQPRRYPSTRPGIEFASPGRPAPVVAAGLLHPPSL